MDLRLLSDAELRRLSFVRLYRERWRRYWMRPIDRPFNKEQFEGSIATFLGFAIVFGVFIAGSYLRFNETVVTLAAAGVFWFYFAYVFERWRQLRYPDKIKGPNGLEG
jgi:hypothetical protein